MILDVNQLEQAPRRAKARTPLHALESMLLLLSLMQRWRVYYTFALLIAVISRVRVVSSIHTIRDKVIIYPYLAATVPPPW